MMKGRDNEREIKHSILKKGMYTIIGNYEGYTVEKQRKWQAIIDRKKKKMTRKYLT